MTIFKTTKQKLPLVGKVRKLFEKMGSITPGIVEEQSEERVRKSSLKTLRSNSGN